MLTGLEATGSGGNSDTHRTVPVPAHLLVTTIHGVLDQCAAAPTGFGQVSGQINLVHGLGCQYPTVICNDADLLPACSNQLLNTLYHFIKQGIDARGELQAPHVALLINVTTLQPCIGRRVTRLPFLQILPALFLQQLSQVVRRKALIIFEQTRFEVAVSDAACESPMHRCDGRFSGGSYRRQRGPIVAWADFAYSLQFGNQSLGSVIA